MHCRFGIPLLLLLSLTHAAPDRSKKIGQCSYFGEPHLLPFPAAPGEIVNQYVCHPHNADEILVKNKFLSIEVTTDSGGNHPIIAYTLVINPVPGYPQRCVISDSTINPSNSFSCPSTSPAVATLNGQSLYIQHLTQNILINIDNFGYFDISVNLPFSLIAKSTGVCVKSDCQLEIDFVNGRRKRAIKSTASSDITDICNAFVTSATKQANGQGDPFILESRMTACLYDLTMTGNTQFARSVSTSILRSSIAKYEDDSDYVRRLFEADAEGQQSFCEVAATANEIVAKSSDRCDDKAEGVQCLQPIDVSKICKK